MIKDFFRIVSKNIRHRKLRSWLTIIGIVISVASIVSLISISNGLENAIEEQFAQIGSNRIFIMPKGGDPTAALSGLTTDDVETLEKMWEFDYVTPMLMEGSAKVEFSNEEQYSPIIGWPTEDSAKRWEGYGVDFLDGGIFKEDQKNVAMIGYLVATDKFKKDIRIKNSIYINNKKFQVVGIIEEIGNSQDDNQIYIPLDAFRELFNKPNEVTVIDAIVKESVDMDTVVAKAQKNLERKRDNENFEIMTPEQILELLGTILAIVRGILVSIASISLVVGCVGILNSMYTSVLERTKEIGIMKSIGATNLNIMTLFLIEAGIIGLIGGFFGVILGMLISFGVGAAAAASGFKLLTIKFDWMLIVGGLIFATVVGMISGALPARQAAKLHPVDALRW